MRGFLFMKENIQPYLSINQLLVNKEGLGGPENLKSGNSLLITLDTKASLQRLPILANLNIPSVFIEQFNTDIIEAVQQTFENITPIVVTQEQPFYQNLSNLLDQAIIDAKNINARVVNLDRFISSPNQTQSDYTNISAGRCITPNGEIIITNRPGEADLFQQIDQLKQQMKENNQSSVIVVDDGLFDIPCLKTYEEIFTSKGIEISGYYVGVGPYGDGDLDTTSYIKKSNLLIESVLPIKNLFGWICGRDFMFCGGKLYQASNLLTYYTLPYFAPFSDIFGDSVPAEKLTNFNQQVLQANLKLVQNIQEVIGKKITFQDIVDAGYGLLASNLNQINPAELQDNLETYLTKALIILNSDFSQFFSFAGFNQLESLTDNETNQQLQFLNDNYGEKLLIIFGSSGVGRSTLVNELIKQDPLSQRIKRITTRELRTQNESEEIISTPTQDFLNRVNSNQIITAVNYPVNNQLYGITLNEISKLESIPPENFGIVEGTGEAWQLKKLFPNSTLVLVLPPTLKDLENRLINRKESDYPQARNTQTINELTIVSENLSELTNKGIINITLTNNNSQKDATKLLKKIKSTKNNL